MSQNAVTRCVPYNNTCSDRYLPELFKRKREGRRKRERHGLSYVKEVKEIAKELMEREKMRVKLYYLRSCVSNTLKPA